MNALNLAKANPNKIINLDQWRQNKENKEEFKRRYLQALRKARERKNAQ